MVHLAKTRVLQGAVGALLALLVVSSAAGATPTIGASGVQVTDHAPRAAGIVADTNEDGKVDRGPGTFTTR
jgi:hypothetical protein